jgi:predicted secreted protein
MQYNSQTVAEMQGWTIRSAVDVLETTKMGTTGWKEFRGGLAEWDGTANVNMDLADPAQLAMFQKLTGANPSSTPVAAIFTIAAGKTFSGTIVVTQMNVNAAVAGLVAGTITFRGSGTLTVAWA